MCDTGLDSSRFTQEIVQLYRTWFSCPYTDERPQHPPHLLLHAPTRVPSFHLLPNIRCPVWDPRYSEIDGRRCLFHRCHFKRLNIQFLCSQILRSHWESVARRMSFIRPCFRWAGQQPFLFPPQLSCGGNRISSHIGRWNIVLHDHINSSVHTRAVEPPVR